MKEISEHSAGRKARRAGSQLTAGAVKAFTSYNCTEVEREITKALAELYTKSGQVVGLLVAWDANVRADMVVSGRAGEALAQSPASTDQVVQLGGEAPALQQLKGESAVAEVVDAGGWLGVLETNL